ncbi:hypothetical protein GCM10011332_33460 [Terasakiella brassicae]|uniref:MobA/VirD2-like nuclease domain-containing protein n=1 Tax=Terasakiella brassicae TaxID=1634917 RepID=A0A917FHJ9_9PROT|nr:relaxase/mobilization nuclease domain-containing protein [Terasakiella brassicae]GGF76791.1 hypothetical protein GCM10011332_33460 [Terasakiella brassicae]
MIINGSTRGSSWADIEELCAHLLNASTNEKVEVYGFRHCLNESLTENLKEMRLLSLGSRSRKSVYHASISAPKNEAETLSESDWLTAVKVLEKELGFQHHQRAIVFHTKQGRKHAHIVWGLINPATLKAAPTSWNYVKHEKAARKIEKMLNLSKVEGVFTRKKDSPRPRSAYTYQDVQASDRTGQDVKQIIASISEAWKSSKGGKTFKVKLADHNLTLARGKRGFILIDGGGNCHSIARRLKVKKCDVDQKLKDLSLLNLPSVEDVQGNLERYKDINTKM